MNFWIIAIALLAIAAVLVIWPLVRGSAADRITGLFIVVITPLAGILLYQSIGTPEAINMPSGAASRQAAQQEPHSAQQGQMDELVGALQQRLVENPDDAEGWLILGRSLKTMQRYSEALDALANANRLMPGNAMLMVELAETQLFASGQAQISAESRELIESALAIDPQQQKGLWLMGMAYAQQGQHAEAIASWQNLLGQLDPASGAANAVKQQMDIARAQMGETTEELPAGHPPIADTETTTEAETETTTVAEETTPPAPIAEGSIPVSVAISEELAAAVPARSVLFVFVHPSGARGMPLAVKRLPPAGFPMDLTFTDADMLQPGVSLQSFEKLDISARISMSGTVVPGSGDIQANTETVEMGAVSKVALKLDQQIP
jgi:cytochrome c-type biogenesis protein CcmH